MLISVDCLYSWRVYRVQCTALGVLHGAAHACKKSLASHKKTDDIEETAGVLHGSADACKMT
eukprot:Pgem_evm1s7649